MAGYQSKGPDPMYDEDESSPSQAQSSERTPKKDEHTEPTALLPKSILAGKDFNAGEEVVLKIVHIYDDQVEVAYAYEHSEEEEGKEDKMAGKSSGGGDDDEMMM